MSVWEVEDRDGIIVAAHNNPPMNYFIGASAAGLAEMLPRWREPDVRVVILTGAIPDRYITHYSVEELVDLAEDREDLIRRSYDLIYGWHTLLQSLSYLDKPIIAAMTGDTGGGGLELSLNCDIRIMQRGDYLLGFPEASLGHPHGHRVAAARAGDRPQPGPRLPAAQPLRDPRGRARAGDRQRAADDARARALEVAERLRTNSAVALTAAKRSVVRGANLPMQEGLRVEAEEWLKTIVTDEAIDAMRDYVARRSTSGATGCATTVPGRSRAWPRAADALAPGRRRRRTYPGPMPELPEVERARALIAERALGRRIAAVDDTDTYVCRPHQPGELAAAFTGRTLSAANRRGKAMWIETDDGEGPILGLHLGMAGRIVVDDRAEGDPAPSDGNPSWDRFTLHFEDGGALTLRDKRRLGRACSTRASRRSGPTRARSPATPSASASAAATRRSRRGSWTRRSSPGSATCSPTRRSGARDCPPCPGAARSTTTSSTACAASCAPRSARPSGSAASTRAS